MKMKKNNNLIKLHVNKIISTTANLNRFTKIRISNSDADGYSIYLSKYEYQTMFSSLYNAYNRVICCVDIPAIRGIMWYKPLSVRCSSRKFTSEAKSQGTVAKN